MNNDNLFETISAISKGAAYDIVAKQRDELVEENTKLKEQIKELRDALDTIQMRTAGSMEFTSMDVWNIANNALS